MSESTNKVLAWIRLMRLPNVLSVPGDVIIGALAVGMFGPYVILPVIAACLFYVSGMILNDVFDLKRDREERPERPLPSGQISPCNARITGWGLMLAGIAASWGGGVSTGLVGLALAICVVLYDRWLRTIPWVGPVFMGACRALSLALGLSLGFQGWTTVPWELVAGWFLYVMIFTRLAQTEAGGKTDKLAWWILPASLLFNLYVVQANLSTLQQTPFVLLSAAVLVRFNYSWRGIQLEGRVEPSHIGGFIQTLFLLQVLGVLSTGHYAMAVVLMVGLALMRAAHSRVAAS